MTSKKKKEEERIEKAIRALLKLPENRRCINCNSLGPQYVCTTFLTFVCTNCSGVHREFTHRVKSVSIAKFTAEEVAALEAAGNERARQIYFKEWDPKRHFYPDSSNLYKLREFVRQVYMDRRFSGENNKLQRLKLSDEEAYPPRRVGSFRGGSRSPHYEDIYEARYSERSSPVGRGDERSSKNVLDERHNPLYAREMSTSSGTYRKSSSFFEIVDNRVREGRPGSGRRYDGRVFSPGGSRPVSKSPERKNYMHRSCSPVVRPVKDMLGDSEPPPRVGECSRANEGKVVDGSTHNQNIASSSATGSLVEKPQEQKGGYTESLIDFSESPEPENGGSESTQHMTSKNNESNEANAKEKLSQASSVSSLEDLQFGFSVPTTTPIVSKPEPCVTMDAQQINPSEVASNDQPQTSSLVPNSQEPSSGFAEQEFVANSKPNQETISGVGRSQSLPSLTPNERTELPADLFTTSFPQPVPCWQMGPSQGMGYNMQFYQNAMHAPPFPNPAKSTNPFDIHDATPQAQAPQFSSMVSLPGEMPANVSSYASMMAPHSASFNMTPSPYMGQHMQNNIPSSTPQGIGGVSNNGDPFASLMGNPRSTNAPNEHASCSSKGGNPFE